MPIKKPNIILINCDDLGYGDLGCYGSKINKTPVIDKMAENGIKFTDFYVSSSYCSPSRGALMTGCYAKRISFSQYGQSHVLWPGSQYGLNREEITIASMLKKNGYATMHIGKWHCGDQPEFLPTRFGFDHYYGLPYSNDMGRQKDTEDKFPPLPLLEDEEVIQQQPDQASLTERYVEKALSFIKSNKANPFFLYFAHMHVHLPLYAPEKFLSRSENGRYGATVACIDWALSVILFELEQLGLKDDTLVIFTSDNGSRGDHGGSNAPLKGRKGTTWEGGMRVPCIMYWPGKIKPGQTNCEITAAFDFLPTIAGLTGAGIPADRITDGKDISPMLFEDGSKSEHKVFYYYHKNYLEAVRKGKWKLHLRKRDLEIKELYDLDNDISENNNVYNKYPDIVTELMEWIEKGRKDMGDDAVGLPGENCRPIGIANDPQPLTQFNPEHPYIDALYDLSDRG